MKHSRSYELMFLLDERDPHEVGVGATTRYNPFMLLGQALPWLKEHGFEREVDPPMTLPPYYYNKAEDTYILVSEISKATSETKLQSKVGKFRDLIAKFDGYQKNLSFGK